LPGFTRADKLAVILHRMWIDGTEFNWSSKELAFGANLDIRWWATAARSSEMTP